MGGSGSGLPLGSVTSSSTIIEYDGRQQTLSQWARETGVPETTLSERFKMGWTPEKALTTPVRRYRRKS